MPLTSSFDGALVLVKELDEVQFSLEMKLSAFGDWLFDLHMIVFVAEESEFFMCWRFCS